MYDKEIKRLTEVNGYLCFCDINHPLAYGAGYVYYHRHLMSMELGRWIKSNEHIHHIDGNRKNNSLDNLILLTNKEHQRKHRKQNTVTCKHCGKEFNRYQGGRLYCSSRCLGLSKRKFNPTKEELQRLVWEIPSEKVGEIFGVSGRAIGKRCKLLEIEKPPRGYWMKHKHV